ncbi:hypothetical protein [Hyphobacterium marinum]|uniref:Sulfotransferase family protein n=1 Tax=Hyphobacterium marinum TaxID=3116574 RepID=A0ABU7M1H2_9PROT|nr:hypothetical protein [Hyphobacterium sp. Y6023]MEE2567668.1 hypothetical protein [Hyphobacterium sp. Y6023]
MYERSDPVYVLNAPAAAAGRGVFVFGAPRGGTSMVAGVLRLVGIDMGARQGRGNNEDLDIQDARGPAGPLGEAGTPDYLAALDRMRPKIAERAKAQGPWGWKDPHGILYARDVTDLLPAPRLIAVFRDLAASAERVHRINGADRLDEMHSALMLQTRALDFLRETPLPAAIVSYEKALVRPERFLDQIATFCGVDVDAAEREAALAFISPERGHGDPDSPGWPRDGAI